MRDVGLDSRGHATTSPSRPANRRSWTGISQLMRAPRADMADTLTEEVIAEAMARAEKVACRPGNQRCYAFPSPIEVARASRTPKEDRSQQRARELGRLARSAALRGHPARDDCGVERTEALVPRWSAPSAVKPASRSPGHDRGRVRRGGRSRRWRSCHAAVASAATADRPVAGQRDAGFLVTEQQTQQMGQCCLPELASHGRSWRGSGEGSTHRQQSWFGARPRGVPGTTRHGHAGGEDWDVRAMDASGRRP
jgi:hypothetical protein